MNPRYLLLATLIASCLACKHAAEEEAEGRFVLTDTMQSRITVDTVDTEYVNNELKLVGKVEPEDNKMANVYAVVGGFVSKVNISLGDYVTKGQVLATIRSSEIADFDKQKRDAESGLLVAEKNLKATKDLFESKLNTERDVAAAEKEVENAKAEQARIDEVMRIYRVNKNSLYNVVAPISGFIIDKKITNETQLPEGYSGSIFTIAQIDDVFITANVYETDIARLKLNMEADVEMLSYPGKRLHGKIDKILNAIDPDTRTLSVRIKLPNPGYALKPDMAATVFIKYQEDRKLPAVPAEAVVFDNSRNYLMLYYRKDSIETRPVDIYKTTGNKAYIQSGLKPGEKVIVKNALMIYDALND